MSFFKDFPLIQIDNRFYHDIFRFVDVNERLLSSFLQYEQVSILDGERPDQLSYRLYGDERFYWTFFIVNDSLKAGLKAWPLSTHALTQYRDYADFGIVQLADVVGEYSLHGLPIDDRVSVKRIGREQSAQIKEFDAGRNQIRILHKNEDPFFYSSSGVQRIQIYSEYPDWYDEVASSWYVDHSGSDVPPTEEELLLALQFSVSSFHVDSYTAKYNDVMTFGEYEIAENEKKRAISVIKPNLIYRFADEYKRLVTNG